MKSFALVLTLGGSSVSALHSWTNANATSTAGCVPPGTCTPPADAKYHAQAAGPAPGNQWNINGGFCGAWSVQANALSVGAWVSQDLVRKANRDQAGIAHNMHGDTKLGYEVVPSNVGYTAAALKLSYEEWDYMQPKPQANAYKAWLKSHLSKGRALVWFPLCKGDSHDIYPGSAPNGGELDHVEPMLGIWSKHPLDDPTVYEDDVILHFSDQVICRTPLSAHACTRFSHVHASLPRFARTRSLTTGPWARWRTTCRWRGTARTRARASARTRCTRASTRA